MTALATARAGAPHGGALVDRSGERPDDLESLEQVPLASRELSDLDMLACGALSPLEGFMGREDYERVLAEMRLASGLVWALPVCLAVDEAPKGDRVALADDGGRATDLALDVQGRLDALDVYRREARPWLPHVTVLRFRERPGLRPPLPDLGDVVPSEAAAYLSRLHPSGARYEVLESVPLGG